MHIAIIDDDEDFVHLFSRHFKNVIVRITPFVSKAQITMDVMSEFDMVYVDYNLGWVIGSDLINELCKHTNADFALISTTANQFNKENLNNERITAIINKYNKEKILEWYHYISEKRAELYPHE